MSLSAIWRRSNCFFLPGSFSRFIKPFTSLRLLTMLEITMGSTAKSLSSLIGAGSSI